MKKLIGVFIVYFMFGTSVSHAGFWDNFTESIDCLLSPVECAGKNLAIGATPEFEKSAGRIADEKIKPLIRDVDTVMKQRLEQFDKINKELLKDADEKVKNRLLQVDGIINDANQNIADRLEQADKIVSELIVEADEKTKQRLNQIDEIIKTSLKEMREIVVEVNNVLQHAFDHADNFVLLASSQLDNIRGKFRQDATYFFDRTEYIIETVDCKVTGTILDIKNAFEHERQEWAKLLPSNWCVVNCEIPYCYSKVGITSAPQSFEYATIYDIKKCQLLSSLGPDTKVDRIRNVYLDLKTLSAKMMCVQRQAGYQAKLHYTWDWLEFGERYDFWMAHTKN